MSSFADIRSIAWSTICEAFNLSVTTDANLIYQLKSYTVSTLPTAASYPRGIIYISNESGGAVPAFSDSTNWRRVTDHAIVS